MQVVLVMFRENNERRSFSLTRDMTIIGRREDCDFRIPLGEISRKHCRLMKDEGILKVEDLGSSNGTYINGVRIQESQLQPGDILKVGSIVFVVQIDGTPADDQLHAASISASAAGGSGTSATINEAANNSTASHLNPTAQSEVGDVEHATAAAAGSLDGPFVITDDATADAIADSGSDSAGEYDPMSILSQDPDDSSAGDVATDEIADDILMDLEAQDQPKSS